MPIAYAIDVETIHKWQILLAWVQHYQLRWLPCMFRKTIAISLLPVTGFDKPFLTQALWLPLSPVHGVWPASWCLWSSLTTYSHLFWNKGDSIAVFCMLQSFLLQQGVLGQKHLQIKSSILPGLLGPHFCLCQKRRLYNIKWGKNLQIGYS